VVCERAEERVLDVPFPLDHFFFCFLPPVAAGAILCVVCER
jgi:hypothetical protein